MALKKNLEKNYIISFLFILKKIKIGKKKEQFI